MMKESWQGFLGGKGARHEAGAAPWRRPLLQHGCLLLDGDGVRGAAVPSFLSGFPQVFRDIGMDFGQVVVIHPEDFRANARAQAAADAKILVNVRFHGFPS